MSNLAVVESNAIEIGWNKSQVDLIKTQIAPGCSDIELQLFWQICSRTGLDPFARQIYARQRKSKNPKTSQDEWKMSVEPSIDGFRLVADRTGLYAGNDAPTYDEGLSKFEMVRDGRKAPLTASVTVWKMVKGVRCPFTADALWDEYYPGERQGFMWRKMPYLMLGKVAEALALRKAFPAELSGLYIKEEMDQSEITAIPDSNHQKDVMPITEKKSVSPTKKKTVEGVEKSISDADKIYDEFIKYSEEVDSAEKVDKLEAWVKKPSRWRHIEGTEKEIELQALIADLRTKFNRITTVDAEIVSEDLM